MNCLLISKSSKKKKKKQQCPVYRSLDQVSPKHRLRAPPSQWPVGNYAASESHLSSASWDSTYY